MCNIKRFYRKFWYNYLITDCVIVMRYADGGAWYDGNMLMKNNTTWFEHICKSAFVGLSWKGKGKAVPLQAWSGPEGSTKLRFPDFMTTTQDGGKVSHPRCVLCKWGWVGPSKHNCRRIMVITLSALRTDRPYPQELHLVLISIRAWVYPSFIVRPEGLCHWKIPMTSLEIEPATCRFVA